MLTCPICDDLLDARYTKFKISYKCFNCKKVITLEINGVYNPETSQITMMKAW